jgi:hypothetical protein
MIVSFLFFGKCVFYRILFTGGATGTSSPRQPVEILSKTAKRMHTVAEYLGMAVTRLSLATMVS